ncbi:hypothetical protein [Conchiformibius kuhniae]|uniref:Uncharacterized protein n=1 Tax=Conchiformibius kuhniae TaxID=211502 RepID=A0A8T9MU12_9NEIS|nr:hypothetical protein [Conchiformibius kuhniae]UOP04741.1 hypothetical protein LVJ77_11315 [Conchiformibius kuhniae]
MEIHTEYQQHAQQLQDTRLRLNAVRALLQLYRLPAPPDDAAVQQVLAAHATPARALTWHAAQGRIGFTLYRPHPQESTNAFLPFNRQIR